MVMLVRFDFFPSPPARADFFLGHVFKQMILKIPAELPQMIIGLEYAEAVKRCEDYAYAILKEVSSESTYDPQ